MDIGTKKLAVFDLDGTLAVSKSPVDEEISSLLVALLGLIKAAIISGGGFPQFQAQVLGHLSGTADNYSNLYILPTSGTRMYSWKGGWVEEYAEHLGQRDKERIMIAMHAALQAAGYARPEKTYGDILEDRGSQITFSALGQKAPPPLKYAWDPDRKKRDKIAAALRPLLPEFDVRVGGATSIDVTRRGINKAYGIHKLEERLGLSAEDIVFVGDALFYGGNDYPAKATGVDCIQVSGPKETGSLIKAWLESLG